MLPFQKMPTVYALLVVLLLLTGSLILIRPSSSAAMVAYQQGRKCNIATNLVLNFPKFIQKGDSINVGLSWESCVCRPSIKIEPASWASANISGEQCSNNICTDASSSRTCSAVLRVSAIENSGPPRKGKITIFNPNDQQDAVSYEIQQEGCYGILLSADLADVRLLQNVTPSFPKKKSVNKIRGKIINTCGLAAIPEMRVTLKPRFKAEDNISDHRHGSGQLLDPGKVVTTDVIQTDSGGYFEFSYESPEVAGIVEFAGLCDAGDGKYCKPEDSSFPIIVSIPDLLPIPPVLLVLTGETPVHPNNHWGTANLLQGVFALGVGFKVTFPQASLRFNDMSLPKGGVFDICAPPKPDYCEMVKEWDAPHEGHRDGTNVDVSFRGQFSSGAASLTPAMRAWVENNCASNGLYIQTVHKDHWHLKTIAPPATQSVILASSEGLSEEEPAKNAAQALKVVASVQISQSNGLYTYDYSFQNDSGNGLEVRTVSLPIKNISVQNVKTPSGWTWRFSIDNSAIFFSAESLEGGDYSNLKEWEFPSSPSQIKPNQKLSGFSFQTTTPPGSISFFAEAFRQVPREEELPPDFDENDPVPSFFDTAFKGTVLGPVAVPNARTLATPREPIKRPADGRRIQ